jgi:pimeloyl-ACP methyl ester carboxylesterase
MRVRAAALTLAFLPGLALAAEPPSPQSQMLALAGGEALRVTILGSGEPILLVPGLFGSAYGFRKVLPRLAEAGYRAIVIEPLGVGESARPPQGDYSLTAQADRLDAALEALGVEQAVVVAHSIGASMAFRLACRHPRRVAALVSIEGGPTETAVTGGFRRAMKLAPLLKLLGTGFVRGKIRGQLKDRSADPRWVTDEVVDGYTRGPAADLGAAIKGFQGMARAREPEVLASRLRELRCPVRLLLGGAPHEGGPSAAELDTLRAHVASLQVERVPGAGHYIFEEAPEAVVAAVERTFDEVRRARVSQAGGGR